jgi:hypothetical protein
VSRGLLEESGEAGGSFKRRLDPRLCGDKLRSTAGGRNEEMYSKYAEGIRVKQYPSRRQHKHTRSGAAGAWEFAIFSCKLANSFCKGALQKHFLVIGLERMPREHMFVLKTCFNF